MNCVETIPFPPSLIRSQASAKTVRRTHFRNAQITPPPGRIGLILPEIAFTHVAFGGTGATKGNRMKSDEIDPAVREVIETKGEAIKGVREWVRAIVSMASLTSRADVLRSLRTKMPPLSHMSEAMFDKLLDVGRRADTATDEEIVELSAALAADVSGSAN